MGLFRERRLRSGRFSRDFALRLVRGGLGRLLLGDGDGRLVGCGLAHLFGLRFSSLWLARHWRREQTIPKHEHTHGDTHGNHHSLIFSRLLGGVPKVAHGVLCLRCACSATLSRSCLRLSKSACAASGRAMMTKQCRSGKACRFKRTISLSRRRTRLRTTAPPTFFDTVNPNRLSVAL